ncbi:MAG: putative transrane protein [Nevskia sp.]|nr:putative transrane protein [Nevskia sp.]
MFEALSAATRSFFQSRILRLVWLPLLGALLLWVLLGLVFWSDLVEALRRLIAFGANAQWYSAGVAKFLSEWIVSIAMLLALLTLTYATAMFITATIAMPIMASLVAARDYPQLARSGSSNTLGSIWNALAATLIYLLLWIGTLPLWLFGVPALVLPALINGWYNDRLFRFDALCEHATRDEYRALTRQYRSSWYSLGVVAAVIQMVPIVNLISPVYSGLSFIHFGFARLTQLRTAQVCGSVAEQRALKRKNPPTAGS